MDFHAALDGEDDPVFLHARLGVERSLFPIESGRADGDLDNEHGGGRVAGPVVAHGSADDRDVGFRFGVAEGERLILPDGVARRDGGVEPIVKELGDAGVEGGFGLFFDDDAADEFGAAPARVKLRKLVILGDLDRRDAGPDFGQIEDRGSGRHGAEITWRGRRVHREIMARGEVCDSGRRKRRRALVDAARARLVGWWAGGLVGW